MIIDLTQGKPAKKLFNLALPMVLSMIFQQLYNLVDSIIVGRWVGGNALYAVSASYSITMIFLAVATGASIGITVVAGRYFGAKKNGDLKTTVSTALIGMAVLAAVFTVVGALLSKVVLDLLKTPPDIIADATAYLQIFFFGLIFIYIYNVVSGAFAAVGDSKTSLVFLIISSVLNIGLDLLFVGVFHMGVAGAAWATLISQAVSAVPALMVLFRRLNKLPSEKAAWFDFTHLRIIMRVAIPSIIQHSIVSLGNVFIQFRVNVYSNTDIAVGVAYSAAIKLNTFAINCLVTMGNAMSSFAAQNLGAGKPDRVRRGCRAGILMSMCLAVPFILVYCIFGSEAIRLFMDTSKDANIDSVISIGKQFLYIVSPFYLVVPIKIISDGVLRGGEQMIAFMTSTFSDLVLRVAFAFILSMCTPLGVSGIWWAWPIGWLISVGVSLVFYFRGKWHPEGDLHGGLGEESGQVGAALEVDSVAGAECPEGDLHGGLGEESGQVGAALEVDSVAGAECPEGVLDGGSGEESEEINSVDAENKGGNHE